jgi:hypothetical protein
VKALDKNIGFQCRTTGVAAEAIGDFSRGDADTEELSYEVKRERGHSSEDVDSERVAVEETISKQAKRSYKVVPRVSTDLD